MTGYRPQFSYDGRDWDAIQMYPDRECVYPGETVIAYIAFLSPEDHKGKLFPGKEFQVREGSRVVATGCVTKILELDTRKSKPLEQVSEARFVAGDRVRVLDDFFWAKGATGTISAPPPEVTSITGPWNEGLTRQEMSALGTNTVYWVWFDVAQHDAAGDGPYRGGQIWESALVLVATKHK
jgi:hypothetical protein